MRVLLRESVWRMLRAVETAQWNVIILERRIQAPLVKPAIASNPRVELAVAQQHGAMLLMIGLCTAANLTLPVSLTPLIRFRLELFEGRAHLPFFSKRHLSAWRNAGVF